MIQPGHSHYDACHRFCWAAKCVFNAALYQMRQALFANQPITASKADKILKTGHPQTYRLLPSAGAQRTTQILGEAWKSWMEASRDFKIHPHKYKGRPSLPGYAKKARTYAVNRNGYKIEDGFLHLSGGKAMGFAPLKITCCRQQAFNARVDETVVADVRIVPLGTSYVVVRVYAHEVTPLELDSSGILSLDLGIDNLAAIVSNQPAYQPVLIGGKSIKSINAKYNKDIAELASNGKGRHILSKSRKRFSRIADYFHKVSRWVVRECERSGAGKIVIGLNPDWKQSASLGRVNNQKFTFIPHASLVRMICYKADRLGIQVVVREESFTSKSSALDLDPLPDYDRVKRGEQAVPAFSGRRIKRGLYKTRDGKLLNADVNGSGNILRKEIGDDWLREQIRLNKGLMDRPIAIKHIDRLLEGSPRVSETTSNRCQAA